MATGFDYSTVSAGHPQAWSHEYKAPFLPSETAGLDPRSVRLHDTVALTLIFDGAPLYHAHVAGVGENIETALYWIAQGLDGKVGGLHVWSKNNLIGVQAEPPHTVEAVRLSASPYRGPPSPTLHIDRPAAPALSDTELVLTVLLDGTEHVFRTPKSTSIDNDLQALSQVVNQNVWFLAALTTTGLLVSTHAGHEITVTGLEYD